VLPIYYLIYLVIQFLFLIRFNIYIPSYTTSKNNFNYIVLQDATINSLVAIEVLMWFYVGEVIGKRQLIGYNIKL